MTIYYSVSTKGFYPVDAIDYPSLPYDVEEISGEDYALFFSGKDGYTQVFDEDGPRLEALVEE